MVVFSQHCKISSLVFVSIAQCFEVSLVFKLVDSLVQWDFLCGN